MRDDITYEILENGYRINLNGRPWIEQIEPAIPYPELSYEESCLKQIDDICKQHEEAEKAKQEQVSLQEQITNLELAIVELYEAQQGGAE